MYLERYAHAFNPPVPSSAEILKKHLVKILTFWIFPSVLRHQTKRRLRHLLGLLPKHFGKNTFSKNAGNNFWTPNTKKIFTAIKSFPSAAIVFPARFQRCGALSRVKNKVKKGALSTSVTIPCPPLSNIWKTISKAISTLWLTTNSLKAGGLQMMKSFTVMKTTAPKHPAALSPNALPAELTTCGKFYIKTPDRHCSSAISIRCWLPQTSTKQNNCIIVCIKHCKLRAAKEVFG